MKGIWGFLIAVCLVVALSPAANAESRKWYPDVPVPLQRLYAVTEEAGAKAELERIRQGAAQGETQAQAALGRLLFLGDFVEPDRKEAERLLTLAAEAKNAFAAWTLYQMLFSFEDPKAGFHWLRQAAKFGDTRSALLYFVHSLDRRVTAVSGKLPSAERRSIMENALRKRLPAAHSVLAFMQYSSARNSVARTKASALFREAMLSANSKVPAGTDPFARWAKVTATEDDEGKVKTKVINAAMRKLAAANWPLAQRFIALRAIHFRPWMPDKADLPTKAEAKAMLLEAAQKGYLPAMENVHLDTPNETWPEGERYLLDAARLGSEVAVNDIGSKIRHTLGNFKKGTAWQLIAARMDSRRARQELKTVTAMGDSPSLRMELGILANSISAQYDLKAPPSAPNASYWCRYPLVIACP